MELVKCPFCGKEIESDSFYCDQCGEALKRCPVHGFKKGNFCNECTTRTALVYAKDAAGQAAPVAAAPSPPAPVEPQAVPQPAPAPVSVASQAVPAPAPVPEPASAPASATELTGSIIQRRDPSLDPVSRNLQPEKTAHQVAPVVPTAKSLFCSALNARLTLQDGAIVGRRTGDYLSTFGSQGYISGTHARLQKNSAGNWEVVDLGSTNGTFLNGKRLQPHQPAGFTIGDTIGFYDLKFIVE